MWILIFIWSMIYWLKQQKWNYTWSDVINIKLSILSLPCLQIIMPSYQNVNKICIYLIQYLMMKAILGIVLQTKINKQSNFSVYQCHEKYFNIHWKIPFWFMNGWDVMIYFNSVINQLNTVLKFFLMILWLICCVWPSPTNSKKINIVGCYDCLSSRSNDIKSALLWES